jgi:hypothetical protein
MEKNIFPNLLSDYKPEVEETRDAHVKDGENSFELNNYHFKLCIRNIPLKSLKYAEAAAADGGGD